MGVKLRAKWRTLLQRGIPFSKRVRFQPPRSLLQRLRGGFFLCRSQYPPKPHECEKSRLTRPGKRITMKSPKDIARAAFMGAGFRVPFSGGLRYMIPHKIRFVN